MDNSKQMDEITELITKESAYQGDGYGLEASQDGLETFVLMHSRMGIRIEYNLDKQRLSLWISPQAGKNTDYKLRNFSNRDDHTMLFDRISFPNLYVKDFVKCDYDPFHSIIHYTGQKLHILSLYDKPAVLVWFENPEIVDLKSDKADTPAERSGNIFSVEHPDRKLVFNYTAAIGKGDGSFIHQRQIDEGRSIYARAELSPEQLLVIAGELSSENVMQIAKDIASCDIGSILCSNETKIKEALEYGKIILKDSPKLQHLYEFNKRVLLSGQDASGAIRASIKYVYYLIWQFDGSVTAVLNSLTGWSEPLKLWNEFMLSNPTVTENNPAGRFFGQLVNGRISKREEYGMFFATWSAFTYWTQTGDRTYISGKYLEALENSMDWTEKYIYDEKEEAFGNYYLGEDPFYGSHDFNWDEAIGRPMSTYTYEFDGERVIRAYSAPFNIEMYNCYLMLASMTDDEKSEMYLKKAKKLEKTLRRYMGYDGSEITNGYYLLESGRMAPVAPGKRKGYEYSLVYFFPDYISQPELKQQNFDEKFQKLCQGESEFAFFYFWSMSGMDFEFHDESTFMEVMDIILPQCARPGRYLPMAYAMSERANIADGEYHDNRPQYFTIGAFQGALANLGVKRLPFGIAVRGSRYIANIENYCYRKALINFRYVGEGKIQSIGLNGSILEYTLQIPDGSLVEGRNDVVVTLGMNSIGKPLLVSSSIRLENVSALVDRVDYSIEAFGRNVLIFKHVKGDVLVYDDKGEIMESAVVESSGYTYVEFEGRGSYRISLESTC